MIELICERCGASTDVLYSADQEDDFGEVVSMNICWSCDHDVMNGGSLFDDPGEVILDRAENNYAYDPINNLRPY